MGLCLNELVSLKDGRKVLLKELRLEDKEKLIQMYSSLSRDAVQWGMPPYTREVVERWLSSIHDLISIVAVYDDKFVGHAQIFRFPHLRRKGTGDLIIYLHQDFHNVGLGTAMLSKLIKIAKEKGFRRIGLRVVADNKRAIHVYQKLGFKVEGVMKDSYYGEDEKYHDELVMA